MITCMSGVTFSSGDDEGAGDTFREERSICVKGLGSMVQGMPSRRTSRQPSYASHATAAQSRHGLGFDWSTRTWRSSVLDRF